MAENRAPKNDTDFQPNTGRYLAILNQLDRGTEVVWWSSQRKAFVTDDMVRQVMSISTRLTNEDTFKSKHQLAIAMYEDWVSKSPKYCEDYIIELWYHHACLYLLHHKDNILRESVVKYVRLACEELTDDGLLYICRYLMLNKEQTHDSDRQAQELIDLLPPEIHQEMLGKIHERKKDF